jgi:hypothetical protein
VTTRSLGTLTTTPPAPRAVVRVPWGRGTEDARGLTALACAAVAGVDGFRVGHHSSVLVVPADRPRTADLTALRGLLCARRARQAGDRTWLAGRALHTAAWGESCVDALPDRAAADAIPDRDIAALAETITHSVRLGGTSTADRLDWHGGLYCGVRDQHRLTVGVQVPWPTEPSAPITAAWLGQVGAPGVLVRTLADRAVPYYAAAAMPVVEHGIGCLSIGLSTTSEHVVALVTTVRDVLHAVIGAGIPAAEVPRLRERAALYDALRPPDDLAEPPADGAVAGKPAVAVVGRLTERDVAGLREAVHEW